MHRLCEKSRERGIGGGKVCQLGSGSGKIGGGGTFL
jgi:hypothetical protein